MMNSPRIKYASFLETVIDQSLIAAMSTYNTEAHKSDGAVAGLEACRGLSPEQIKAVWQEASRKTMHMLDETPELYWFWFSYSAEVEWVLNCLSAFLGYGLLPSLPTLRADIYVSTVLAEVRVTEQALSVQ